MATPTNTPTKSLSNRVSDLERGLQQLTTDIEDHISKERALIARIRKRHGMFLAQFRCPPDEFSLPSVGGHPFDEPPASLVTTEIPDKANSSAGQSAFAPADSCISQLTNETTVSL